MPFIGDSPIAIPEGVTVQAEDGTMRVRGPKGELERFFRNDVVIHVGEQEITLSPACPSRTEKALRGTYAAHLRNMIKGVTVGFRKTLLIEGVGYRATREGEKLVLALGFSHPVVIEPTEGIAFEVEKNRIIVSGADKERVGQVAATIRAHKKPEPYKGKGIHYHDEVVRRKAGKKASTA
ncbi:MAG: 50S ribosomal protein L6 [Parcubacteria group bacterium]|nr:50S ribosomal protein L6 [Parcubacteria group bacterium]